jgi:hypothetical protein
MIYLLALFVEWVRRALVPAAAVFAIATLAAIGVRLIFGRSRLTTNVWLALGIAVVAVFGWRTFEVWQDFSHPQYRNFRSYVADPIPRDARALVMDSPAPAMFYDGALVRFEGPSLARHRARAQHAEGRAYTRGPARDEAAQQAQHGPHARRHRRGRQQLPAHRSGDVPRAAARDVRVDPLGDRRADARRRRRHLRPAARGAVGPLRVGAVVRPRSLTRRGAAEHVRYRFFSSAFQLSTTVSGTAPPSCCGASSRNRWPSADTTNSEFTPMTWMCESNS